MSKEKEATQEDYFKPIIFDLPDSSKFTEESLQRVFVKSLPKKNNWISRLPYKNVKYIYDLLHDGNNASIVASNIMHFSWMKENSKKKQWVRMSVFRFGHGLIEELKRIEEQKKEDQTDDALITETKLTEGDTQLEDQVSGLGHLKWTVRSLQDYIVKMAEEKKLQNSLGTIDTSYVKAFEVLGKLCKDLINIQEGLHLPEGEVRDSKKIVYTVNNTIQAIYNNVDRKDKMTKATIDLLANLEKCTVSMEPDDKGVMAIEDGKQCKN